MIMAKLRAKQGRARYFEFLIDSGANYTLISKSDAYVLGIDYKNIKKNEIKVEVANMTFIHGKKINLILIIENIELKIPVFVAKEEIENLLGRKGVFEYFDVLIQERKKQVILRIVK